jgi:hypothetical protein
MVVAARRAASAGRMKMQLRKIKIKIVPFFPPGLGFP